MAHIIPHNKNHLCDAQGRPLYRIEGGKAVAIMLPEAKREPLPAEVPAVPVAEPVAEVPVVAVEAKPAPAPKPKKGAKK